MNLRRVSDSVSEGHWGFAAAGLLFALVLVYVSDNWIIAQKEQRILEMDKLLGVVHDCIEDGDNPSLTREWDNGLQWVVTCED